MSTIECKTDYKFIVQTVFKDSVNAYTKEVNLFLLNIFILYL